MAILAFRKWGSQFEAKVTVEEAKGRVGGELSAGGSRKFWKFVAILEQFEAFSN